MTLGGKYAYLQEVFVLAHFAGESGDGEGESGHDGSGA